VVTSTLTSSSPASRSAHSTAAADGFAPIKINMVVQRGVDDHTIVAMARRPQAMRAPELPVGCVGIRAPNLYLPPSFRCRCPSARAANERVGEGRAA
jgi:hypothetical protein